MHTDDIDAAQSIGVSSAKQALFFCTKSYYTALPMPECILYITTQSHPPLGDTDAVDSDTTKFASGCRVPDAWHALSQAADTTGMLYLFANLRGQHVIGHAYESENLSGLMLGMRSAKACAQPSSGHNGDVVLVCESAQVAMYVRFCACLRVGL